MMELHCLRSLQTVAQQQQQQQQGRQPSGRVMFHAQLIFEA